MGKFEDLPREILLEILYRLPVISLGRAKCCCSEWHAVISNPEFHQNHLTRALQTNSSYFFYSYARNSNYFSEEVKPNTDINSIKIPTANFKPLLCKYYNLLLEHYESSGGLLARYEVEKHVYHIWNPIIGDDEVQVPAKTYDYDNDYDLCIWWGFGYEPSTFEYKIIQFTGPKYPPRSDSTGEEVTVDIAIYILGSSRGWRELEDKGIHFTSNSFMASDDGVMYWETRIYNADEDKSIDTIGSFDLASENFRTIQAPTSIDSGNESYKSFYMKMGKTIGFVRLYWTYVNIWVLRGDKVRGEQVWIKEHCINYACFADYSSRMYEFRVLGCLDQTTSFGYLSFHNRGGLYEEGPMCHQDNKYIAYDANSNKYEVISLPFCGVTHCLARSHIGCLVSPAKFMDAPPRTSN